MAFYTDLFVKTQALMMSGLWPTILIYLSRLKLERRPPDGLRHVQHQHPDEGRKVIHKYNYKDIKI